MDANQGGSGTLTRDDFIRQVRELGASRDNSPDEWNNTSIADYLMALAAWVEDMDGYFANIGEAAPPQPTWELFAQILLAARVYE